jgi:hypothetical protein
LAALGLVAFDAGWQVVRHLTVMAHEGAHAVIGLLLFRDIGGIVLHRNATGATNVGSAGGLPGCLIGLSGYLGPSAFGLGAAKLIQLRLDGVVVWGLLFLLAVLLTALRWSFGIITVLLAGGIVFVIGRFTPMTVQVVASYSITWLLLLSGVRRVIEVGAASDDGAALRGITHLPGAVWFVLWLAATLAAVVVGGSMLIPRLLPGPGGELLTGFRALPHDVLQRQPEGAGQCGHGEERRGRDAAGLDLAQRLRGHAGRRGDLGHAARPAGLAEQGTEPFPASAVVLTERRPDHGVIIIPV